jgi:hypothetical protein
VRFAARALFALLSALLDVVRLVKTAAKSRLTTVATLLATAALLASSPGSGGVVGSAIRGGLAALLGPSAAGGGHLLLCAAWFGASLWVSFGQGDLLAKSLSRHAFAQLRCDLRPRFLGACVVAGALALLTGQCAGLLAVCGAGALRLAVAATLAMLLVAEPQGSRLAALRDKFETDVGIGAEVGSAKVDESK